MTDTLTPKSPEIEKELTGPCRHLTKSGACGNLRICPEYIDAVEPHWTEKEMIEFCKARPLVIKSCKTCIHPGQSPVGCPAQECHDCCQLSNWQSKDPLPRMGSGYSNQGGATEENDILGGLLKDGGDKPMSPSKQLLEYARELKNEAKLHNIKIEQMIKKLNKFMEENK